MLNRFKVYLDQLLYIDFSEQLKYMLGFSTEQYISHNSVAKYDPDLSGGLSQFCIYVDGLIDNIIMGNKMTNLLRVINIDGDFGKSIEKIYENPIFIPVNVKEINNIHIEIRTLSGTYLPMAYGHVIISLIFRKRGIFLISID